MGPPPLDERIVILAPSARDGPVMAEVLGRRGLECLLVAEVKAMAEAVAAGAGAVLLTEEALGQPGDLHRLEQLQATQEPWSDLPVLFLTTARAEGEARSAIVQALARLGNVTLLDRPLSVESLASAVRSALRARRRQYAARAVLQDLQRALASVRETEAALRESEARFRTVVEHSRDGINLLDLATRRYVFLSPAQVALTGFTESELRGMTAAAALERVHPEDREVSLRQQRAIGSGEEPDGTVEYRWKVKSGEYRWFSDSRKLVRDERGQPVALVGVSRDITERKQAAEELRLADRRKSEFLAVLSHELRNPLAPIRNGVQLLERAPPGSEVARRAVEILRRQSEQLTRLVEDLLDITRISRGKLELKLERLDAREVIARAVEDARQGFEHRGVALWFSGAGQPVWIDADAARLTQMVGNLLHNALKFTPPGGRVEVSLDRTSSTAEIAVRDTGAGIEPSELERIFEAFVQTERTRAQRQGGLGIGLALVRALAEKHGGGVRAHSDGPDRGATLVLSLPLAAAPPARAWAGTQDAALRPLSIVIVEDNEDAGTSFRDLLALAGHDVRLAMTGREGIAEVLERSPDLLFCDVGLPDVSGHDVIRAVRSAAGGARVFAVALTGYAQAADREVALRAGFDAHLAKPPAISELQALIAEVARRKYLRLVEPGEADRRNGSAR